MNKTKEIYVKSTEFHFGSRDELNGPHPSFEEVSARNSEWIKLPKSMSVFHDNGIEEPELKFVHSDGREAVFDGDTLKPILDPKYKGTFNYVVPVLPPENKLGIIAWVSMQ